MSSHDNRSRLPHLVEDLQDKLMNETVECIICYDTVKRNAPIWSCSICFLIFHLHCIKKWARVQSAEEETNWECPGCRSVQRMSSKDIHYVCFCEKMPDPPWDPYLTPHSCGQPCEKEIGSGSSCPHRCVLQCHPGPCPPCKAFAPPRLCPCGKKVITLRCADQKSLLTCGKRCGKPLNCLRHCCDKTCHVGPCDSCEILLKDALCFCKKKKETVICGEMVVNVEKDGIFSCSLPCGKPLDCGNHVCKDRCHPGVCGECDLLPARITSCSCGKSPSLQEDPGPCPPCHVMVTQKCRCGSTSRSVECFNATTFTCEKPCGRQNSCGRHHCSKKCCPLSNSNNDPHLCSKTCEKKLRCGQHECGLLCHSGPCPPCPEGIFTDLTCACGRSSIPPPLPCGTVPPTCQHLCSVPQPCGHLPSHTCHFGDYPPCSVLIPKKCIGGHVVLENIPCGSKDIIKCNNRCGKRRQCGMHACSRTCHPPPCDSTTDISVKVSCGQTCGQPRRDCRHKCTSLCHPYVTCPDVNCKFPVTIRCGCGRIPATVPCDAGGNRSGYNADYVLEQFSILKLPLQRVDANGKKIPLGQRKLMCDDECKKIERHKVLADAFGVANSNFGENPDMLWDLFRRDPEWVLAIDKRCKMLVVGGVKVHVFCPMSKEKRDEVRIIAERWRLSVRDVGLELNGFIVIHVTPESQVPSRVIGRKGLHLHPPSFDHLVDMDPRLVVALFDMPSDADVSALILRFGGECELVWLNDKKNALAVFSDPARAATAMGRLNHGSVYYGATVVNSGTASSSSSSSSSSSGNALASYQMFKYLIIDHYVERYKQHLQHT